MEQADRERLVRVEEGITYIKQSLEGLPKLHDDVQSLKQTQTNARRFTWGCVTAAIVTGITFIFKGAMNVG